MKAKVNLTIDETLTRDARALSLNMSALAEAAISEAVQRERNRRWAEENRAALDAYAREVAETGLALAAHRTF